MDQPVSTASWQIRVGVRRDPSAADLPYPRYMTDGAAGADVFAAVESPITVRMGEIHRIPTGLFLEIPEGFEAQVRARSGLALKSGIALVNAPGTIDSDYRGELGVILTCLSNTPCVIERGMRIAQLVFTRVARAEFIATDAIGTTVRGSGGFGHTGLGSEASRK